MKQNQKNRFNGRYPSGTRSNKQLILRNTALESTGPAGKLRGTALQLVDKYQAAAKDALLQNDRVLAETFLQYADHYIRIQNIAAANEQALRPMPHLSEDMESENVVPDMPTEENEAQPVVESQQVEALPEQKPIKQVRRVRRPAGPKPIEPQENAAAIVETV